MIVCCISLSLRTVMSRCRILGSGTCYCLSAYAYHLYRITLPKNVAARRFELVMGVGFLLLGTYRAVL